VGNSMAAIANETAGLIRNLDLGPVIIIGHSMGGMQAQIIASKYPDVCAGLVLSCTHKGHAHPFGTPLDEAVMERIHQRERMDDSAYGRIRIQKMLDRDIAPDIFSFLASVAGEVRVEGIISGGTAMHYLDTTSLLKRITAPVMILTGELDIVVLPTAGAALRAELPNARHIQLAGVGHAPYCEDAPHFNAVLSSFLESI
jgi:3-oxoadipate enol-lactonase